ncbi:MAG: glycosyltransferase, partial [Candidatus Bathyarchaeia archaeon]
AILGEKMFSVIIPTFNEERNIEACFRSLRRQRYSRFEVIVVDSGSHDRTREIARRYGYRVLEVERRRPHDVGSAKNEGARHAVGDALLFLDADTVAEPNCLSVLEEAYEAPGVIGVSCRVLPLGGNGTEMWMYQLNNILARFANRVGVHEFSYFSCHSYLKAPFEKVGGFNEDLHACEDLDLSLRIRQMGRFIFTSETTLWTSPRRLRNWSYPGYISRYARYLIQYYFDGKISDYYI